MSITLEDAADDPVLEPAPGTTPLWPTVRLKALFDAAADPDDDSIAADSRERVRTPLPPLQFEDIARIAPGNASGSKTFADALRRSACGSALAGSVRRLI